MSQSQTGKHPNKLARISDILGYQDKFAARVRYIKAHFNWVTRTSGLLRLAQSTVESWLPVLGYPSLALVHFEAVSEDFQFKMGRRAHALRRGGCAGCCARSLSWKVIGIEGKDWRFLDRFPLSAADSIGLSELYPQSHDKSILQGSHYGYLQFPRKGCGKQTIMSKV